MFIQKNDRHQWSTRIPDYTIEPIRTSLKERRHTDDYQNHPKFYSYPTLQDRNLQARAATELRLPRLPPQNKRTTAKRNGLRTHHGNLIRRPQRSSSVKPRPRVREGMAMDGCVWWCGDASRSLLLPSLLTFSQSFPPPPPGQFPLVASQPQFTANFI